MVEKTLVSAHARLNARIMPLRRGELFEDPLAEALEQCGFGEVGGGGTLQSATGEIEGCGIDVDLYDVERGVPFVCDFLARRGAPAGSSLEYEADGRRITVPFGDAEGLGLYLNGTELPEEVYRENDVNDVFADLRRLLADAGAIWGFWQGAFETALYAYGPSAAEMRRRIDPYLARHPLCQRSRLVILADRNED